MARRKLKDGTIVEVPDDLSPQEQQRWIIEQGANPALAGVDPNEFRGGTLPSRGAGSDFAAGLSKFIFDRTPGMGGVFPEPPETFAATAGGAAVPIAAGVGLGIASGGTSLLAQGALQGGLSAGLELARGDEATPGSVAGQAAIGTLGTFGGNMVGRVLNSIAGSVSRTAGRGIKSDTLRPIIDFADDLRGGFTNNMARARTGSGAFNFALKNNIRAMNERVAKVFDFDTAAARNVRELDEDFLQTARVAVNRNYKNAAPTQPVAVDTVRETVERIPERLTPGVKDAINMIDDYAGEPIPKEAWQPLQRILRDTAADLRAAPDGRAWARVADDAIDQLDSAAGLSGGNRALLGKANQQYKMLATLEENNAVIEAGEIPAGQLVRLMGRNSFKGHGRKAVAEGLPQNVMPEVADVLAAGKQMARFGRDIAGGSATAGRNATFGPAQSAVQGLLSGTKSPAQAAIEASSMILTPGIGRAATEVAGPGTRGIAGGLAQSLTGQEPDQ